MRVLSISADRSAHGDLFEGTAAFERQLAYARRLGALDVIGFSRRSDGARSIDAGILHTDPTDSSFRLCYGWDALRIARALPRPDLVSAQDPFETGFVAYLIARRFGVPLHIQVHTDFLNPAFASRSLLNRLRVFIAGYVIRRAAGIRVVSERVKREIEDRYHPRAPISVLPIFFDIARYRTLPRDPQAGELVWAGRFEPEKNPLLALDVFAGLLSVRGDAHLTMLGSGSLASVLKAQASEAGIAEKVSFPGWVDPVSYLMKAELVLSTSRYEGYGLSVVEALAAGVPVLSTDVGVAREAGAIIAPAERFAEALQQWAASGPRTGVLASYPYSSREEYVARIVADMQSAVQKPRS